MLRGKSCYFALLSFLLLAACAGQQRGMSGDSLVSSSRPAVEISVPDLPLRASGFAVASVTTGDSLGGVAVESWLAVYGGSTLQQPMAIVALAEAPSLHYWDSNLYQLFSVDQSAVSYDGQGFYASTYIVDSAKDAFAQLLPGNEEAQQKFIARRFAQRSNFNMDKITLEYREPLPADVGGVTELALYDRAYLDAFEQRAYKAFVVRPFTSQTAPLATSYLKDVQVRFLNTNFFGTLSRVDALSDD